MKFHFALFLLSFFSLATLASNPYNEFLELFTLPDPPKGIVESTHVKKAREELEAHRDFFKGDFDKLQAEFDKDKSDKSVAEKKSTENLIFWIQECVMSYRTSFRPN